MARFPITFENEGQQLFGVIHRPEGDDNQPCPGVAIFHGFLGSKHNPPVFSSNWRRRWLA